MRKSPFVFLMLALLAAIGGLEVPLPGQPAGAPALPPGPRLHAVQLEDAPLYIYLFTHTEDHINHDLSEERYWRIGPMLEAVAERHPGLPLTWTIEFQGADAATVAQRNGQTGLVDYLLDLNARGLVEFGYHAHHDPTYLNRPQRGLGATPSWQAAYDAIHTWVTCVKDPVYGGCVQPDGGGLQAILDAFGQVEIVTGIGLKDGALIERSAGRAAITDELPGLLLGFGFPDHGGVVNDPDYAGARDALLALLSPTQDTSSSVFWRDNALRINDGAPVEGVDNINLKDGVRAVRQTLEANDRTRPHVLNAGLADKFIYTRNGTSPTIWAYAHPEDPVLPPAWLNPPDVRERYYAQTEAALDLLADTAAQGHARFVSSDEVVGLFTSRDYWNVDGDELEQIALWLVEQWGDGPPAYAYDGQDYYALTDAYFLLLAGLRGASTQGLVSSQAGPWHLARAHTDAVELDAAALRQWAGGVEAGSPIPSEIAFGGATWTPAQVLYGLAVLFAAQANGLPVERIHIPATAGAPETYELLDVLGCTDCLDTAWSLKPARFQGVAP